MGGFFRGDSIGKNKKPTYISQPHAVVMAYFSLCLDFDGNM
jgi:hypothetical protein